MQWDSWRLWEGWAAGCVVMHIDFDKYGCRFPVQPQNWVHYVGFDLDNIDEDIARFLSLRDDELRQIADNGRSWAIEHYSPRSAAERFLSLVDIRD
ncbi:MAG: glycosyltransferase [Treponemataceae bacterium]